MPVIPAFLRVLKGLAIRSIQFCFSHFLCVRLRPIRTCVFRRK